MSNKRWKLFAVFSAALSLYGSALAAVSYKAGLKISDYSHLAGVSVSDLSHAGGQQIYVPPSDVVLRPSADYNTTWTCSSGTARWDMVNEAVKDNDTTYIYRSDSSAIQKFSNLPSLPAGTILGAGIYWCAKPQVGTVSGRASVRVNGIEYSAAYILLPAGLYSTFYQEWDKNPHTGLAWTEADLEGTGTNSLESWGVGGDMETGETMRITQVYMVVRYN